VERSGGGFPLPPQVVTLGSPNLAPTGRILRSRMPPIVRSSRFLKTILLDRRVWALSIAAGVVATYPLALGALGGHLVTSKVAAKLGVSVEAQRARAGWGVLRLYGVVVGKDQAPF